LLKDLQSYYKPHLGLFIADMVCAVFMAVIDVAFPMFSRYALNTLIPKLVTLLGILTEVRPVQPSKAQSSMLVTPLGMLTEIRLLQ
jgi:ATP-binding cassette subfamily B protein